MTNFSEFCNCLANLSSDKITERKKQSEHFRRLLKNDALLKELDEKTDEKKSEFTWPKIFQAVKDYIRIEFERLGASPSLQISARTLTNRQNDLSSVANFFKEFVQTANKRGPRLNSKQVVKFILDNLKKDTNKSAVLSPYSRILVKDILIHSQCHSEIPVKYYNDLISFYTNHILEPVSSKAETDPKFFTRVLFELVEAGFSNFNLNPQDLFEFLKRFLKECNETNSPDSVTNVLKIFICLCQKFGTDCRAQFCEIGEIATIPLIKVLRSLKPKDTTKNLVIEFFRVQISLHHPQGAKTDAEGFYASNGDTWRDLLFKIYDALFSQLQQIQTKRKHAFNYSQVPTGAKHILILTLAEICYQVFEEEASTFEVTQLDPSSSHSSKRRKVEIGISLIIECLQQNTSSQENWLQLLIALLEKYPSMFTSVRFEQLFEALNKLYLTVETPNLKTWLFQCSQALLVACHKQNVQDNIANFSRYCQQLWELAIKTLSLNACHDHIHRLLSTLLEYNLVLPKSEFFRLFTNGSNTKVTDSSVTTVNTFLLHHPLPHSSFALNYSYSNNQSWFKYQILEWLFPPFPEGIKLPECNTDILSDLLCNLCLQRPKALNKRSEVSFAVSSWDWMKSMEQTFLILNFNETLLEKIPSEQNPIESSSLEEMVYKKAQEILNDLPQSLICTYSPDIDKQGDQILFQVKLCSLLHSILKKLVQYGALNKAQLNQNLLTRTIQNLLRTIFNDSFLGKGSYNAREAGVMFHLIHQLLPYWDDFLTLTNLPDQNAAAEWVISLIPVKLITRLRDIHTTKHYEEIKTTYDSSSGTNSSSLEDFDDNLTSDSETNNTASSTPVDINTIMLDCFPILTKWCKISSLCLLKDPPIVPLDIQPDQIFKWYAPLITRDSFNFSIIFEVQMFLEIGTLCCCVLTSIAPEMIKHFLDNFTTILFNHYTNPKISSALIRLTEKFVPFLIDAEPETKKGFIDIINKLWILHKEKEIHKMALLPLTDMLGCLVKNHEYFQDVEWGDTGDSTLLKDFPKLLLDDHNEVILCALNHVKYLFQTSNDQEEGFKSIYYGLVESAFEPDSAQLIDKKQQRKSALLLGLSKILLASSCCERLVMFALCQVTKEYSIPPSFIVKVLQSVLTSLGYPSVRHFSEAHLPYLVHEWFEQNYSIDQFPFEILEIKEAASFPSFLNLYYKELFPIFLYHSKSISLESLALILNTDLNQIVRECLPHSMSSILPWYSDANLDEEKKRKALDCTVLLETILPKQVVESSVLERLDDLLIHLLSMVKDEDISSGSGATNSSPLFITTPLFKSTIEYLTNSCNNASMGKLLGAKEDRVQNILLFLREQLYKARRPHNFKQVLHMYDLFVDLCIPELKTTLKDSSPFFLFDIAYSITGFLTSHKSYASSYHFILDAIAILKKVFSATISYLAKDIEDVLPIVIECILPFTKDCSNKLRKAALKLLTFLMVDNASQLKNGIALLSLLPSNDLYSELRTVQTKMRNEHGKLNLKMEFNLFLSAYHQDGESFEGLAHLLEQIKQRKEELLQMATMLQNKPLFTEDLVKSPIHLMICCLMRLSTSSNKEIQEMALKCLGEIGPINLDSLILQPSSANLPPNIQFFPSLTDQRYCMIFLYLASCLKDNNFQVVSATVNVLKKCLATSKGKDFSRTYKKSFQDRLFDLFKPFAGSTTNILTKQQNRQLNRLDDVNLWTPDQSSHAEWIRKICVTLINSGAVSDEILRCVIPICETKVDFCEKIVPHLIKDSLENGGKNLKSILSKHLSNYFSKHVQYQTQDLNKNSIYLEKTSVQTILSIVHYLRQTDDDIDPVKKNSLEINFALDLNYLDVGSAAYYCSAYFTTILYAELWFEKRQYKTGHLTNLNSSSPRGSQNQLASVVLNKNSASSIQFNKLLLDAYNSIGEYDAMFGCSQPLGQSSEYFALNYSQDKQFHRLLSLNDLNFNVSSPLPLLQSLHQCSLYNLMFSYLQSQAHQSLSPQMLEYQAECSWRLEQWDMFSPQRQEELGFHQSINDCIKDLIAKDSQSFVGHLKFARQKLAQHSQHLSLESTRSIYTWLSKFSMLNVLEDSSVIFNRKLFNCADKWLQQEELPFSEFEFVEPIRWLCCVLQKNLGATGCQMSIRLMEKYVGAAIKEEQLESAQKALYLMKNEASNSETQNHRLSLEEAKLFWLRNEHCIAKQVLQNVLPVLEQNHRTDPQKLHIYCEALTLCGDWLAELKEEKIETIIENYYEKSIKALESSPSLEGSSWNPFFSLARYSDVLYQELDSYITSPSFKTKKETMERSLKRASELNQDIDIRKRPEEMRKNIITMEKHANIDMKEIENLLARRKLYLKKTLVNYMHFLGTSDIYNLRIFRLISLWFQNQEDEETCKLLEVQLKKIPTYIFIPVLYQLVGRMGNRLTGDNCFHTILSQLIITIAEEHPYHVLPILFGAANTDKDQLENDGHTQNERSDEARAVLTKLKKNPLLGKTIEQMDLLTTEYIKAAYIPGIVNNKFNDKVQLPLFRLKNLNLVPIITEEIPVNRRGNYKDFPTINKFEPSYKILPSLTCPKLLSIFCSDGKKLNQLLKGKDDLRQDAVMEQVYGIVNKLLVQNKETKKRNLSIRTYKVVPLSKCSGLIQWCNNVIAFGDYLGKESNAHARYHPKDWNLTRCLKEMAGVARKTVDQKIVAYNKICQNLSPVFRFFFLENFPEPTAWYERRLAYTRSVACTSIVGYIMGLGDRHCSNILIDKNTAEVIHIDFGFAFEKGLVLPTPEKVPFRLSRDIVDGMGVLGVEGVFKRCCEKTMEEIRASFEVIYTIVEVLLYDPLYDWSTPKKQGQDEIIPPAENINMLAHRALTRLKQKLQGEEDGATLSSSGQVNLLIQKARDPMNLCQMYQGWQPFY